MIFYFIYLLEASICLGFFFMVYQLFLKGDTFYHLKRIYLISIIGFSLLIPQLPSTGVSQIQETVTSVIGQEVSPVYYQDTFENVVFGTIPENIYASSKLIKHPVLFLIYLMYFIGCLYFIVRFIINMYLVLNLYRKCEKEKFGKYTLLILPDDYSTFSFLMQFS